MRAALAVLLIPAVIACSCGREQKQQASTNATKDSAANALKTDTGNLVIPSDDVSDLAPEVIIRDSSVLLKYEQLVALLPDIPGYKKAGAASGEGFAKRTSGGLQSYVKQEYANGTGKKILVEIVDYGMAKKTYEGLMSMYIKNAAVIKEGERSAVVPIELHNANTNGYYTLFSADGSSRLIYGVSDRFLFSITGYNLQDLALLRNIARKIPYSLFIPSA
jgi:hypothetical protein